MKKTILICLLGITLFSGCQLKNYYEACKKDAACVATANHEQQVIGTATTAVVAIIPHPVAQASAPLVGKIVGYLGGFIAMLILGHGIVAPKKQAPNV